MLRRPKANDIVARALLAAPLSILLLVSSIAPSLCLFRCVHAAPAPPSCHHHSSGSPRRAGHPCEHACTTAGPERSADLVAQPSAPKTAAGSTAVALVATWSPPIDSPTIDPIEHDVGPPLP